MFKREKTGTFRNMKAIAMACAALVANATAANALADVFIWETAG